VLTGILAVDDIIEIMADQLDALTRLMGRGQSVERALRRRPFRAPN
jgi:hypothetical protein